MPIQSFHMIRYPELVNPNGKSQNRLSAFIIIFPLSMAWNETILFSSSIQAVFSVFSIFLNPFQDRPEKCSQQRKDQHGDCEGYHPCNKQYNQQRGNTDHKKNSFRDSPGGFDRKMNELYDKHKDADHKQYYHFYSFFLLTTAYRSVGHTFKIIQPCRNRHGCSIL